MGDLFATLFNRVVRVAQHDSVRRLALAIGVVLALILIGFGNELLGERPVTGPILVVLLGALVSIEVVQSRVGQLLSRANLEVVGAYESDSTLAAEIARREPDTVYMLEYSSAAATDALRAAIDVEATIYLLVRNPDGDLRWPVSDNQAGRTGSALRRLQELCYDKSASGLDVDMNIRLYNQQASLRGRRLDDETIYAGWYTFDNRTQKTMSRKHVQGDNNPAVRMTDDAPGYHHLQQFFEESFYHLWYEGEDPIAAFDRDALGGEAEWFAQRPERREWLESVSETDAEDLFPRSTVGGRTDEPTPSTFRGAAR